ncbi:MAG: [acyl-carrier-protein] S-malonyltransferase [Gammaproteobacteria bacterium]|jgi:[acyl-carrier-protein] S-malonyltransferase|nr:[acyl-carrier-protein] S-malonyltransferase [Gammaproteobacteria bacterium]|tara:strand:- start:874 stop:1812 length:939 start_codon:yes stop_codon:yes gene_type:complete
MSKLAYVFPGQGSQKVGMLEDAKAALASTFAEASEVLDYDLWALVQEGPAEKLGQTEFTQPALLTASVGLWRLAQQKGAPTPDVVAGHSLGEYSALVAASVMQFTDAVSLVSKRGRFMQNAVPVGGGGMAAVLGLGDEEVKSVCGEFTDGEVVQAANFNSPGQVVIAGQRQALEAAIKACKEAGAKRVLPLPVSAPFHSSLMQPAAELLEGALADVTFAPPQIRIVQNVDADYCDDPESIRNNLVEQMYKAVLWSDTIRRIKADGVSLIVECGPGRVLSGFNRRIEKSLTSYNLNSLDSVDSLDSLENEVSR